MSKIDLLSWTHLKSELIWIYDDFVNAQSLDETTFVAGQSAFLIQEGEVLIRTEKGSATAGPGQWIFPKEGFRRQRFSPGTKILSLHFNLTWPGGQGLFDWEVAAVVDSSQQPRLEREATRLRRWVEKKFPGAATRLLSLQSDLQTHLDLQQRFLVWLAIYTEALLNQGWQPARLGAVEPRMLHVVQLLDRLPLNQLLHETNLAAQIGLSASQLDRLFTKQFGMTPRQYREHRRLREAMARTKDSCDSFKMIAFDLGFGSLSHFSSWLRKKTSLSPRQLRAQRGFRNG